MPHINVKGRNPGTVSITKWFDYEHLPKGSIRNTSQQFYDLAANMIHDLPDSPELVAGLRKLLEAKDCFVRAAVDAAQQAKQEDEAQKDAQAERDRQEAQG